MTKGTLKSFVLLLALIACQAFTPSPRAVLGRSKTLPTRAVHFPLRAESNDGDGAQVAAGGINTSGEPPFEIRGFSLATSFLAAGAVVTVSSFVGYFNDGGGAGVSGLGFVYGIPILLIGLSLKYAELAPVEVKSTPAADAMFEKKATETLRKVKQDVTRHRYGDDAHLDSTLKALGLQLPQKDFPELEYLVQGVDGDELTFSMVFRSPETPFNMWVDPDRIKRYESFFGPGLRASVEKVSAEERLVAIKLTTGTAAPAQGSEGVETEASSTA